MISNFSTTTLADKVEEHIIEYIKNKSLVPGDSLPNEMQFVEMFGISRNVVREGLSRLRMLGLIQTRTKRGIIITEPPLLNSFQKILDPRLFSTKTIKEMMGMRIVLEIGVAEFLFANINDSDILALEQIVSRQQALGINNLSVEDELLFHTKIYEIAGNNFITQFNKIMHPVFIFVKHNYESYFQPISEKLDANDEIVTHSKLLQIIKTRDVVAYQEAMKGHLKPYWEFMYNFY